MKDIMQEKDGRPCLRIADIPEKVVRKEKLRIQKDKLFKIVGSFKMKDSLKLLYVTCSIFNQSWCTQRIKMHVMVSTFQVTLLNRSTQPEDN
jgi:hypothetical protein